VGKKNGEYELFYYKTELSANEIEFSDEMFLITRDTAEAYLAAKAVAAALEEARLQQATTSEEVPVPAGSPSGNGAFSGVQEQAASYQQLTAKPEQAGPGDGLLRRLIWKGEIPALKWNLFYMKVLTRFATGGGLKLTVQMDLSPEEGISRQKVDETRIALRDLGLSEDGLEDGL
jgi:hypothetical protein